MWPGAGCPTARTDAARAGGCPQTLKLLCVVANYSGVQTRPGGGTGRCDRFRDEASLQQKHWAGFHVDCALESRDGHRGATMRTRRTLAFFAQSDHRRKGSWLSNLCNSHMRSKERGHLTTRGGTFRGKRGHRGRKWKTERGAKESPGLPAHEPSTLGGAVSPAAQSSCAGVPATRAPGPTRKCRKPGESVRCERGATCHVGTGRREHERGQESRSQLTQCIKFGSKYALPFK